MWMRLERLIDLEHTLGEYRASHEGALAESAAFLRFHVGREIDEKLRAGGVRRIQTGENDEHHERSH